MRDLALDEGAKHLESQAQSFQKLGRECFWLYEWAELKFCERWAIQAFLRMSEATPPPHTAMSTPPPETQTSGSPMEAEI